MNARPFPEEYGKIELHPQYGEPGWDLANEAWWEVIGPDGTLLATVPTDDTGDAYGKALAILGLKRPYRANKALYWLRDGWDYGDPWGSGCAALGAVCDVLLISGEMHRIPDSAGYCSPYGPGFSLDEAMRAARSVATAEIAEIDGETWHVPAAVAWLMHGLELGEFGFDEVEQAARILSRYLDAVRNAGKDY